MQLVPPRRVDYTCARFTAPGKWLYLGQFIWGVNEVRGHLNSATFRADVLRVSSFLAHALPGDGGCIIAHCLGPDFSDWFGRNSNSLEGLCGTAMWLISDTVLAMLCCQGYLFAPTAAQSEINTFVVATLVFSASSFSVTMDLHTTVYTPYIVPVA